MNKFWLLAVLLLSMIACKESNNKDYAVYGEDFEKAEILNAGTTKEFYKTLKAGDTVEVAFEAPVASVCKAKGCWMKLDVGGAEEVMVKFKDYGFFMPTNLDSIGKPVTVHGKAFVAEVSVEEQKHYAEDAGKTPEEIAAITTPKRTLSFTADGVTIAN